ncbi:MAG TPA: sigma-70 family RNA polymerase sigma factor [Polyangiaceae bacterium]
MADSSSSYTATLTQSEESAEPLPAVAAERVTKLVEAHFDFVWRTLCFVGLDDAAAEDGAQQVMCILARRIEDVAPGAERSFLFSTAMRVAGTLRRTSSRHPESGEEDLEALVAETPSAEELVDERRAHELLRKVLAAMPVELRIVFVLYEIEEMTMREIAETLGIPAGTAASRLRRGREEFQAIVNRMQAARRRHGDAP